MPAAKNSSAAPQRRGHQRSQQQDLKASCTPKSKASAGRMGARHSRSNGVATQKSNENATGIRNRVTAAKKATGTGTTGNKAVESCAWPAYARSTAEAEAEVLDAVASLYADELKPVGRILRKRVAERILESRGIGASIVNLDALPEVDGKQVRAVCDACRLLRVDEEDGGDWSVVHADRPSTFVDVYCPVDSYPKQLWPELQAYCETPEGQAMSLPGGRYASAQALKALQLPLFAGFSLGRICHIVQLAISQKKILGYMNGAVVPYVRSQSMMKERCAMYGQPSLGNSNGLNNIPTLPIASLEDARKHVNEILDSSNGEVPLSNIKRLFRSRFQLELSETSFGYSKLSELLQDSNFSDICSVELRGHGYMVTQSDQHSDCMSDTPLLESCPAARPSPAALVPATPASKGLWSDLLPDAPRRVPLCADEPLSFDDVEALIEGEPMLLVPTPTPTPAKGPAVPRWCLSPSRESCDGFVACSVQHTFLQYKVPQTPLPGPKRRSHSLPKDMGRSKTTWISESCFDQCKPTPVSASRLSDETQSTTDGSGSECLRKSSSRRRSESGSSAELSSDEESFGCVSQLPSEFGYKSLRADSAGETLQHRVKFCPDEPLGFEESGVSSVRTPGTTPLPSPSPLPAAAARYASQIAGYDSQIPAALASCFSLMEAADAEEETDIVAPMPCGAGRQRVTFCPDEPLGIDEAGFCSASPKPSPALVLRSPALTPSPLYNYSDRANLRRHLMSSLPPQALPELGLAPVPSSIRLPCSGSFAAPPPPPAHTAPSKLGCPGSFTSPPPPPSQPVSVGSIASDAPRQTLHPGCIIRLGEYL